MGHQSCPDGMLLSQMLDAELPPEQAAEVRRHVADCNACTSTMAALAGASATAAAATRAETAAHRRRARPAADAGSACLAESRVSALVRGVLEPADARAADAHLQGCDRCLRAAAEAIEITRRLAAPGRTPVPSALASRVASRWASPAARPTLTEIVVRVARDGLELLGRSLGAGVVGVEELALAAPALRGDEPHGLSFVIRAPDAEIRARLMPDAGTVALVLTLVDSRGRALAGERVSFRRQRRSVFSARTDDAGELVTPRLETAVYEVSCPGIATDFRLDLRG